MTIQKLHERHFHVLQTDRLQLRPLTMADTKAMFAYTSLPESFQYLRRSPHISEEEDRVFIQNTLEGYRQHREFIWGICFQGELIGTCRLFDLHPDEKCCEVSYLIHPAAQGRGIASEAVRRLIQYAFDELDLEVVFARCAAANTSSERIMQKCGMKQKAVLPRYAEFHGVWHDFLLYEIEKETSI